MASHVRTGTVEAACKMGGKLLKGNMNGTHKLIKHVLDKLPFSPLGSPQRGHGNLPWIQEWSKS